MRKTGTGLALLVVLGCWLTSGAAAQTRATEDRSDATFWIDSVQTAASKGQAEPSLQYLLDSLGYSIDVANDETGEEVFCGHPGLNMATMVIEVAGSAVYATSGYYAAHDTSIFYQLFGPSDGPGDSVTFNMGSIDSVGFYMKPNLPNNTHTWLSENSLNYDAFNHMKAFPTGVPHQYIMAFEDLPNGGDMDWNDLVIKVTFFNEPPVITLPADFTVVQCNSNQICFDITAVDPNCQGDSLWITKLSGLGSFSTKKGKESIATNHCFTPSGPGVYSFTFQTYDILGAADTATLNITVQNGTAPIVSLGPDFTIAQCSTSQVCIPVSITDPECDVTSVTSTPSGYAGTEANFDQIDRINDLGGTVTQIGGGNNGGLLTSAASFVPPVNTLSGVSVTLPNFIFASSNVSGGSFSTNPSNSNSAFYLLGAPTDLTYTTPGAGGPDGGGGDGSVDFTSGNHTTVGFAQSVTTCNGSNSDLVLFTNTGGGGTVEIKLRLNGSTVSTITQALSGAASGSGAGGVVFDLPDGLTFNEVRIKCTSGTIEADALAARIAPSPTASDICFTADTSGLYTVIVTATDACGNVGGDTLYVTVQTNQAPVANAGADFSRYLCSSSQVCFPVTFSDPNNNLQTTTLLSGPGTLAGNQICFTPTVAGSSQFVIQATDSCGLTDRDTVVVTVTFNSAPVAVNPSAQSIFQCSPAEICHQFSASDINGGSLTWSLLAGSGTVTSGGLWCFTPTTSGVYNASVVVTDSCGAKDTTTISRTVTLNAAPVAVDPTTPVSIFQCTASQICYQFSASDADGGQLIWSKTSGAGTITGAGLWCFTPVGSGSYTVNAVVTDSCGRADTTTLTYNVTVNGAPSIAFGADTTISICPPQQLCFSYSVSDPQGTAKLTETLISGSGTIDTAANTVCFTPTTAGVYQLVVGVTDSCGASDRDTINVTVNLNAFAMIDCPASPISVSLCDTGQVCQALTITPANATVTVNNGATFSGGQLCFTAASSGTYSFQVIATAPCSVDTCDITFNVTIGQAAQIACPSTQQNFFLCSAGPVCIPVGVMGAGATVNVSPIGSYSAGQLCFTADTAGQYSIRIIAATTCGTDTCDIIANVALNGTPVAANPPATVDTFLCAAAQLCRTFTATDPDSNPLSWTRLSGAGTVTPNGQWCFNATTSGSYSVTAVVADSCGAADTVSMTYNVTINAAPSIAFGSDTTIFQCAPAQICVPFTLSDLDANIQSLSLVSGSGVLFPGSSTLCFTPAAEGAYTFVAEVIDSCGASDRDTIIITIDLNAAPVASAGSDQTIFQCNPAQICLPISSSDPENNITSVVLVNSPGTIVGNQICFTPTGTLNYEFVIKVTDACGLTDEDTVFLFYTLNSAPLVNAGSNQTLFQCSPTQICWPVSCSDVDGNLTDCSLESGPGTYDGTQICFTPTSSGSYTFVMRAGDACGAIRKDTVVITVTQNSAPLCSTPNDTTILLCTAAQICLPAGATDPDGNLELCQIVSGPGVLLGGNWCYTPSASQVVTVAIQCQDSCGAICVDSFTVNIIVNLAPSIAFGPDIDTTLCASGSICLPYLVSDPNDPRPRTTTLLSGSGTIDTITSEVCFTPATSGTYTFVVRVEDECGAFNQDTITVTVDLNVAPVASAGADQALFQCTPAQVCWPASCSDANGNLSDCIFNGPGTFDGSTICFTPAISGAYLFTLRAIDSCGLQSVDTVVITITINSAPTLSMGADTSIFLCTPTKICLPYTVADADGLAGLTEQVFAGFGTLDTVNNRICFTPTTAGSYQFILDVRDGCNAIGSDTQTVTITFGEVAAIDCPTGPIPVSLCGPDSVRQTLAITPAGATVTVSGSGAVYSDGQVRFFAAASGTYAVQVIASAACGADTCDLTFNVTVGVAAEVTCPTPAPIFNCTPGQVCIPVTVMGTGAVVTVSPTGSYAGGLLCFNADTSGTYTFTVIAATTCGADTCSFSVTITNNQPPVAINPRASALDTFLCANTTICQQFTASDPDGGTLSWIRIAGNGTVDSTGLWCFSTSGSGSYTVTAVVSDSCGARDTVTATVNVTLNTPPIVTLPADFGLAQCSPAQVCFTYTTSDPDNNISTEVVSGSSGTPTINTTTNEVFFTPTGTGIYTLVVTVTDACGAADADTINVSILVNQPPVASAGADEVIFSCDTSEICRTVSATDPSGNLQSLTLVSGAGSLTGNQLCFVPSTSGSYTFVIQATDSCGASDRDTVIFTVTLNSGPVCQMPPADTTTFFQCTPTQVSLPVSASDPNGNFERCEIIGGPGSLVGGNWVFTPSGDQFVKVKIQCIDSCGASCIDSFFVRFNLNAPPVAQAGRDTTLFICGTSGQICVPASCSDEDNNLSSCEVVAPPTVTYSAGQICLTASTSDGSDKTYTVILKATDSCGATDFDTVIVTANFNATPVVAAPPNFTAFLDAVGQLCFDVSVSDPDNNLGAVTVSPIGSYNSGTGQVCFMADSTGTYCLVISATDGCGAISADTVCVTVQIDECIHVQIETTAPALQGQITTVDILLNGAGKDLGGFDFLIAYDASALQFFTAVPGTAFEACDWEFFDFRQGADGNCGSGCPSGLLRIVGLAETNNGAYHPSCYLDGVIGSLASIDFLVSNDRTLNCSFSPISFFWIDCGDNTFSSKIGDTLWISRNVYSAQLDNITSTSAGFPTYQGADNSCLIPAFPDKPAPQRCVDFTSGGIQIICSDSIDARGDINLNGSSYEVGDAVMFTNYFLFGLAAFQNHVEGSIAASDINNDGNALTVADLVYLISVIVGDASPVPKIDGEAIPLSADIEVVNGMLRVSKADERIGAMHLVLAGEVTPELAKEAGHMELEFEFDGENTRVLIFSMKKQTSLSVGDVVDIKGAKVKSIEIGSSRGQVIQTSLASLPTSYTLSQNYPNPFNPVTTIDFSLPERAEWRLEIFNVLGQTVTELSDTWDAGYYKIDWDASTYASGIYFYRLTAGGFSTTKKMVLLK